MSELPEEQPEAPKTIWEALGFKSEEDYKAAVAENFAKYPLPPDVSVIDCYQIGHELFDQGAVALGAYVMRLQYKIEVQSKQIDELVASQFDLGGLGEEN